MNWQGIRDVHILRKPLRIVKLSKSVSKIFRTGRLERELQMVQLSTTGCSCIAILWVNLVSFAAVTLSVASQRVFIVVVYFVIDSVRKLLDTPSYVTCKSHIANQNCTLPPFKLRAMFMNVMRDLTFWRLWNFEVFCVVTPCSVVVGYQSFTGSCCLHLQGGPLKRWYPTTALHGVIIQKTFTWIFINVVLLLPSILNLLLLVVNIMSFLYCTNSDAICKI
jgi:hypothetical protein